MEAILFIGLQASGKSRFYQQHFFNSHLRVSNDLLKTKNRESKLLDFCFQTSMKIVLDNTNLTREVRARYIALLKQQRYRITGYYFKTDLARSLAWNQQRKASEIIPDVGILGAHKKLQLPNMAEGFDQLYYVDFVDNQMIVKEWQDEI